MTETFVNGNIEFSVDKYGPEDNEQYRFWIDHSSGCVCLDIQELYDMVQLVGTYIEEELLEVIAEKLDSKEIINHG